MSDNGSSFPTIIQLQFRRAKAICKRDAVGQLFQEEQDQDEQEIYVPVRPTFDPYKAGANSVNRVTQPVLCASGEDDEDDQDIPLAPLKPGKQNSSAQVALSVEQYVVRQKSGGLKPREIKPFRLGVRLSENEHEIVVRHAEKAGLTVSEYVRVSALGPTYASSIDPEKRQQLLNLNRELSRQGTNLNQIAKHLNAGIVSPEQGESMLAILARALLGAHMAVRKALAEGRREP